MEQKGVMSISSLKSVAGSWSCSAQQTEHTEVRIEI